MPYSETEIITRVEGLEIRELRLWVERGWVRPVRTSRGYRFDEMDIARLRLLRQLQDELGVAEETVPLVLSLMDQVYGLRRELRLLAEAIAREPEEVRSRILGRIREVESGEG